MGKLLYRTGLGAARRPWMIVASWAVALAAAASAYGLWHGALAAGFDVPGLESMKTVDRLAEALPEYAGASGNIVLATEDGEPFSEGQRGAISKAVASAADLPDVALVVDPFQAEAERDAAARTLAAGREQIEAGRAKATAAAEQIEASLGQLDQEQALLDMGKEGLPPAEAAAQQAALDQGRAEIEARQTELAGATERLDQESAALEKAEAAMGAAAAIRQVSEDGHAALVAMSFTEPRMDLASASKRAAIEHFQNAGIEGVEVVASVDLSQDVPDVLGWGEVVGLVLAALVLTVMFRALIPTLIPVIGAVTGVAVTSFAALACSSVVAMSSITPLLAVMLGLAVGVDYSLFIVNRHRRQLLQGVPARESVGRANGTAGSAVVFAGGTVAIALASLGVTGVPFLGVMGVIGAAAVVVAVIAAVTLTPAILGLAGLRALPRAARGPLSAAVDHDPKPGRDPGADGDDATHGALGEPSGNRSTGAAAARGAGAWRAIVQAALAAGVLATVAIPAASMRLGLPDGSSEPVDSLAWRADAITREAFGPGANGPLVVVVQLEEGSDDAAAQAAQMDGALALADQAGVAGAAPVAFSAEQGLAVFQVVPDSGPNDEATEHLVRRLRTETLPQVGAVPDQRLGVAGQAAINTDMSARLADALLPYLALVVGLSLLILVVVFRSILVPLVAALGFILSLLATLGAVVAVFQWGWGESLLGVGAQPVLNFLPIILVGLVFGLAMDYQIFLATGMREAYLSGTEARAAVAAGLRAGRPVVVAAGLIMVAIFGAFVLNDSAIVKPVGFGLAFGVVADAFVVRLVLMPALLRLLGPSAWWLPRWADRIVPRLEINHGS